MNAWETREFLKDIDGVRTNVQLYGGSNDTDYEEKIFEDARRGRNRLGGDL